MSRDERPRCGTCVHNVGGECRRMPPVGAVIGMRETPFGHDPVRIGFWPPVTADSFCSEHPDFMLWHINRQKERAA